MTDHQYDMIVVGAGPAGLSCAIEARTADLSCLVLEQGTVADAIRRFPVSMTFFSTPDLLEIGDVPFLSSGFRPTRQETVRYYQHVADHWQLPIQHGAKVTEVGRNGSGFRVTTSDASYSATYLVIATGYFDDPTPFKVRGSDLPKVKRYYGEAFEYFGKNVAVVGGKNSAVETALDLHRNGASVTLIHRGATLSDGVKYWILPDIENRLQQGDIKGYFNSSISEITKESIKIDGPERVEIANDAVLVMIGYTPDTRLLESAGVTVDNETRVPAHAPESLETNVRGLFVAGSIAAGRFNNRIFIENGRSHGSRIVRFITGKD